MENEGYEEEQAQLDVPPRRTARKGHIAETIESFHASVEGHIYEDILVSENATKLSKNDTCSENMSLELELPTMEVLDSSGRSLTTANCLPDPSEDVLGGIWPSSVFPLDLEEHRLAAPNAVTKNSCAEDRHDSECERRNAEISLKSVDSSGQGQQVPRQPSRRRRKKDCKHCKHRFNDQQFPRRQDPIAAKCPSEGDLSDTETNANANTNRNTNTANLVKTDKFEIHGPNSIGLLPAFGQMEKATILSDLQSTAFFPISDNGFPSSDKSAKYPAHRTSSKTGMENASTITTYQAKPVASMRVNSIYSQDRSYSRDSHIFFTDVEESCAFKRAYSFPTRLQSPVIQNRVNLRRSVRGEPPPERATLSKDRHGWTLHFVKPLRKRACSRALVFLILVIIALVGIGSIALYIMCEPERLRIIQQYLRASANSANSANSNATNQEINRTMVSLPATGISGAEVVDMLLNGRSLFTAASPTPGESAMNVQVETVESLEDNFTRYCDDCLAGDEVCVALISEEVPICRRVTDRDDPTGCGGLCIVNKQKCHRLDIDAFRCLDVEHNCLDNEWSCSNALCIPLEKRCDGHMNCYDHSDEHNCICNFGTHFQCGNETSCLSLEKRCDSKIDCWDATDEISCTLACPMESQFTCTNGECILKTRFCDGLADCTDGSDEPDGCQGRCNKHEFTCGNNRCIAKAMKCNGSDDCGDGTDERHCKNRQR